MASSHKIERKKERENFNMGASCIYPKITAAQLVIRWQKKKKKKKKKRGLQQQQLDDLKIIVDHHHHLDSLDAVGAGEVRLGVSMWEFVGMLSLVAASMLWLRCL